METNVIYNEECLQGMEERIPDNSIDMILTDIPYGETNRDDNGLRNLDKGIADQISFDLEEALQEFNRVCSGSFYIFCGFQQLSYIDGFFRQNNISRRCLVWEKTNPSPMNGEYIWLSGVELCVYGKKPGATFNGYCDNTVLRYPSGRSKEHPTQKPLDMFKELIEKSSDEGDIVLDPFLGSGTTAVAAKVLDRKYIGFEQNEEYYKIAQERVSEVQKKLI